MATCDAIRACSRPPRHGTHHGGFRSVDRSELLSRRELEVYRLLALGRTSVEGAEALGITLNTLRNHRARAVARLAPGAATSPAATIDVLRAIGWLQVPR